jgi:hypothetical protein
MNTIDPQRIAEIVNRVMRELQNAPAGTPLSPADGLFDDVESAIAAVQIAQKKWVQTSKSTKAKVIAALRCAMHEHAEEFARGALEETGMGRLEDKIFKHHNVATVTPGLEDLQTQSWIGDKGLVVEEYAPFGVIAAITPSTHPIPVLFNSTVIMIAPGNGVVFNVHPAAKKISARAMQVFSRVIQENGGPANLIAMLREPTLETAHDLFHHSSIPVIVATAVPDRCAPLFKPAKKSSPPDPAIRRCWLMRPLPFLLPPATSSTVPHSTTTSSASLKKRSCAGERIRPFHDCHAGSRRHPPRPPPDRCACHESHSQK